MASTNTSVPPVQFTSTGLVVPTETAVLAGVQADINAAFGGGLNPALNTPQGQLASTEAAIISNANATFAEFVNQVDPDTAEGFMQDAIGRIYFLTRQPGTPTAVQVLCTGLFGTEIGVGAQAQDTSGNIYVCTQAGEIGSGGTVTLAFANIANGPIPCPAGQLNQIYQAIPGWESVTNLADGVVGSNVETRTAFEYRRVNSVAINAKGSLPAIYAACFEVPGVIDVYVTQNNTSAAINTGSTNYPIAAKSVYVAVIGGDSVAVATAIWNATNAGPGYQSAAGSAGATIVTENIADPSGYSPPIPTYPVSYVNPASTPVYFSVNLSGSTPLPSNYVSLVQNAIVAQFTGTNGGQRARIGALLLASSYYGPIALSMPTVGIVSVFLGLTAAPTSGNTLQMGIDQAPTIEASNISVNVG